MTSYFDDFDQKTEKAGKEEDYITMRELETKFVFEISVCISFDDFPADLREKAHRIILDHAVDARPANARDNERVNTWSDHVCEIGNMSFKLHSLFHEFTTRDPQNNSDNPMSPLRRLACKGESFREQLWESEHGKTT